MRVPSVKSWVVGRGTPYDLRPRTHVLFLQISPRRLFPLDGLEQCPEVALAEAAGPLPLDDLVKHRRSVLDRLGEDLQQVSVRVPVHQDTERGEHIQWLVDVAHAPLELMVVAGGHREELDAPVPKR